MILSKKKKTEIDHGQGEQTWGSQGGRGGSGMMGICGVGGEGGADAND